jgi:hypothetical protein
MKKNELLKQLGFSDQFLKELDDYNNGKTRQIRQDSFSNDFQDFIVNDTSNCFIEKLPKTDSVSFMIC